MEKTDTTKTIFASTRHRTTEDEMSKKEPLEPPRLGRRESEPHSTEVSYLYDVLMTNFSEQHHTLWDLHHYFLWEDGTELDLQFDISFFLNFKIPFLLPSYRASNFKHRVPDVVINVLSRSTWRKDIGEIPDLCCYLKIPVYIIFAPYNVATKFYQPPFLRVYILDQDTEAYKQITIRHTCIQKDGTIDFRYVVQLPAPIPFWVGLSKSEKKGPQNQTLYRLVLIDPKTKQLLGTRIEKERIEAEKAKAEAEKAKAEAEKAKAEAEKAKAEAEKYRSLLKKHGLL